MQYIDTFLRFDGAFLARMERMAMVLFGVQRRLGVGAAMRPKQSSDTNDTCKFLDDVRKSLCAHRPRDWFRRTAARKGDNVCGSNQIAAQFSPMWHLQHPSGFAFVSKISHIARFVRRRGRKPVDGGVTSSKRFIRQPENCASS